MAWYCDGGISSFVPLATNSGASVGSIWYSGEACWISDGAAPGPRYLLSGPWNGVRSHGQDHRAAATTRKPVGGPDPSVASIPARLAPEDPPSAPTRTGSTWNWAAWDRMNATAASTSSSCAGNLNCGANR